MARPVRRTASSRKRTARSVKRAPATRRSSAPSLKTIDARLQRIENLLTKDEKLELAVENEEKDALAELKNVEELEKKIEGDLNQHPLTKITYHDVTKGMLGSFFGVVGHFAFFEGTHLAETLSYLRATMLIFSSMLLLIVFLYFTGFRRVTEYHAYLPLRFLVIYLTAISVATIVLFLFGFLTFPIDFHALYTNIAALSILAVMGAAAADLIGGEA